MDETKAIRITRRVAIPRDELTFRFMRSGGPGGQHVNTSSTQVELTFDVAASAVLTSEQKVRLRSKLGTYMSGEGVLRLTCQSTRSQKQNREEVVARFAALVRGGLAVPKPRRPTKPTRAAKERRLASKKRRSERKRQRRFSPDAES